MNNDFQYMAHRIAHDHVTVQVKDPTSICLGHIHQDIPGNKQVLENFKDGHAIRRDLGISRSSRPALRAASAVSSSVFSPGFV